MEKELNYLSEKIEKVEQRIDEQESAPNLKDSLGLQHVLKCRKEELELLNNILNILTELALAE